MKSDFAVKILISSFLAQIFVVGAHHFASVPRDFADLGYGWAQYPAARYGAEFFYHLSIGFGTVVFFAIAGYLFFNGFGEPGAWRRKMGRRVKTLGVPYLIWNFLASPWFTALLLPVFALFMPWLGSARETSLVDVFLGHAPGFYPANAPLWFVRELLLVCVLSPVLWLLIRGRFGIVFIAVSFIGWILAAKYMWGGVENIAQAIFAFSLGGYWNVSGRSPFSFSGVTSICAAGAAVVIVVCEIAFDMSLNIVVGIKALLGCVIVFGAAQWLSTTRWASAFAWLGEASFFIYLVHIIGRGEVSKLVISAVKPQSDLAVLLTSGAIFIIIFAYTIGAWALMRRFAPRLLSLLTGGRSARKS